MSDPQQQSPAASSSTSVVAKTHYLQQQSAAVLPNPLIDSSSSTSLLIGTSTADLLLDEHQLGLHSGGGNERVETLGGQINDGTEVGSSSQWAFNNLFHQMGHQSFVNSNDQLNQSYEHTNIGQQHAAMCNSNSNAYSTSNSHYFNYTLSNEFPDSNSYSTGTSQNFFPSNLQLPYNLPYNSNATQSIDKNSSLQNEDGTEDSTYSANSSADTSRSPSTDSSRKENPSFYTETKPTLFGSSGTNPTNFHQRSPFEPFCVVPGRMSLLSSTTKYKVTIGEIQRRISPPECLNASLLGGILRKAKSKDGGKALRESLRRIGLTLPAGRRKSAHVTALTALVEEEAVHMAKDFHSVCERDFPTKEVAHFLSRHVNNDEEAHQRRTMLHYVRMYIKEVSDLMNADRSPVCASRPDIILEPSIQKVLTHFSMVTHGFGGLVFLSVLDALNNCVHESIKHLDRNFNTNRQNSYVFPS